MGRIWTKVGYRLQIGKQSIFTSILEEHLEISKKQFDEKIHLSKAEVSTAIKSLKAGKAPGEDDV